jgi:hypothetical protein
MSQFEIVKSHGDIKLGKEWIDSPNYKNRLVDESGKTVPANYEGRKYLLIAKKERSLTFCEQAVRVFIVALAVICTFGVAWLIPSVREFAAQKKESREFGMPIVIPSLKSAIPTPAKGNSVASSALDQPRPPSKANQPVQQAGQPAPVAESSDQARLKAFFQSVTPSNIDELLQITFPSAPIDNCLGIHKSEYGYRFCLFKQGGRGGISSDMQIENNQFKYHINGTSDYGFCDNLDQFLDYLFKGNFYQGSDFNSAKCFFIITKQGVVNYQNPHKAQDPLVYDALQAKACSNIKAPR